MKTSIDCAHSIRYAAIVAMIFTISAGGACSSDTIPTAPPPLTREPVAVIHQLQLSGTVTDDDGTPVSGVVVRVYRLGSGEQLFSTVVTDEAGFYSLTISSETGILIFTSKQGYRSGWHAHLSAPAADFQWNLRISRAENVPGK